MRVVNPIKIIWEPDCLEGVALLEYRALVVNGATEGLSQGKILED